MMVIEGETPGKNTLFSSRIILPALAAALPYVVGLVNDDAETILFFSVLFLFFGAYRAVKTKDLRAAITETFKLYITYAIFLALIMALFILTRGFFHIVLQVLFWPVLLYWLYQLATSRKASTSVTDAGSIETKAKPIETIGIKVDQSDKTTGLSAFQEAIQVIWNFWPYLIFSIIATLFFVIFGRDDIVEIIPFFSVLFVLFGAYEAVKTKDLRIAVKETVTLYITYAILLAVIMALFILLPVTRVYVLVLLFCLFLASLLHILVKGKSVSTGVTTGGDISLASIGAFSMIYVLFLVVFATILSSSCDVLLSSLVFFGSPIISSLIIYRYFGTRGVPRGRRIALALANCALLLIVLVIMPVFPDKCGMRDARFVQSNSYWRGEARPFAILEHSVPAGANPTVTLVIQNNEASGSGVNSITGLTVDGPNGCLNYSVAAPGTTFSQGETKTITFNTTCAGAAAWTEATIANVYELQVIITYIAPNGVTAKQFGTKAIVGKYT